MTPISHTFRLFFCLALCPILLFPVYSLVNAQTMRSDNYQIHMGNFNMTAGKKSSTKKRWLFTISYITPIQYDSRRIPAAQAAWMIWSRRRSQCGVLYSHNNWYKNLQGSNCSWFSSALIVTVRGSFFISTLWALWIFLSSDKKAIKTFFIFGLIRYYIKNRYHCLWEIQTWKLQLP